LIVVAIALPVFVFVGESAGRLIAYLAFALLVLPVHVKRYHDLSRSGWWAALVLVPFVAIWPLLQCGLVQGETQPNQFGPPPKGLTRKQRRVTMLLTGAFVLASVAAPLVFVALTLEGAMAFFQSPTEVTQNHVAPGKRIRLGGLVKPGTLVRGDNLQVKFEVTDGNASVPVSFTGILPDLFREGQGVVTEGALDGSGHFKADSVLAKHDERYMPKEVADALKKQGHWKAPGGNGLAGDSQGAKK